MILTHGANSLKHELKGLVYSTDFKNFNLSTMVDKPEIGNPISWIPSRINNLSIGTVDVKGVRHNCLKFSEDGNGQINLPLSTVQRYNVYSCELDFFAPTQGSDDTGGLEISGASVLGVAPYFNTYTRSRGIGVKSNNPSELFNGFSLYDNIVYKSDFYGAFDFSDVITGGFTIDAVGKTLSMYLLGKKALKRTIIDVNGIDIYFNSANVCVTGFRIYDYDRFSKME